MIFSSGKATSINTLGSDVSVATAMSGTARIAGYNIFDSNPNSEFQAFLYSNGSMKNINSASPFPSGTAAWGVQVVGTAVFRQTQYHPPKPGKHVPFISTSKGLVDLNTLISSGTGFTLTDAVGCRNQRFRSNSLRCHQRKRQ